MKQLYYIFLLSLLVAGAFCPPIWVILIILSLMDQDSKVKHQNKTVKPYIPPSYQKDEDLNIYRHIKPMYLKSQQWNTTRKSILKRDKYTCQSCGISDVSLEVHHITYTRFMVEQPEDLVTLCRQCHQSIHDRLGYDYNSTFPVSEL